MHLITEGWTCQNYALNSGYALNNNMLLTTGFYGTKTSKTSNQYIVCDAKEFKLCWLSKQDVFAWINKPEGKKASIKLRMYKLFKENFQLEYYLTTVATVKYSIALTWI